MRRAPQTPPSLRAPSQGRARVARGRASTSLLKRWLPGAQVLPQHLDYYFDEFTFNRFNRRTSRPRGLLFYRLAQQAAATTPTPYRTLVGGKAPPDHNM